MTCRESKHVNINEILDNNIAITDPNIITNKFNNFFSKIGADLAKQIPPCHKTPQNFLKGNFRDSMFLDQTDESEIFGIINSLKNTTSKGHDNIPVNIIKHCATELSPILTHINNASFTDGVFPDLFKIAKVIPIFKSGDSKQVANYRPISILPMFSKITERLVYNRLIEYLNKNLILHSNQFGFRQKFSTCMALLQLVEDVSRSIDENKITMGVFVDLAKAFDTVNHSILLDKLYHYGARGIVHQWFQSYLSGRRQYVLVNKHASNMAMITCGVPQGSILGPLLFIIYINDLVTVSNKLKNIMFADDTNLFITGHSMTQLEQSLNEELDKVNEWFMANLLSLNISKTSYMIFGNKRKSDAQIRFGKAKINRVDETKFLGIIISSNLKWKKHIEIVHSKASKSIGILCKIRHLLPQHHTLTLYHTLVEPYLNYCCLVWGGMEKTGILEKIHKLQKQYCRIISFSSYRAHSNPLFRSLNILTIYSIYKLQLAVYMFRQMKNLLPGINPFNFSQPSHKYNTRHKSELHIDRCRTKMRQSTVQFQGPKLWNSLPQNIVNEPSLGAFKNSIKKFLVS